MSAPATTQPQRSAPISPWPQAHAQRITDAVNRTWRAGYGHLGHDIPLSVIAALSMIRSPTPAADLTTALADQDRPTMLDTLRQLWTLHGIHRPDLTPRFETLARWLAGTPSRDQQRAAHAVATTALRHGLLELTADPDRRHAVDLLGLLLQALRGPAHTDRGQVYTPPAVCELIARITLTDPTPGQRIYEPAAGTGGLLRAAAQVLRQQGIDPAAMAWVAGDIDPLAAGCLAVNARLWDLGPHVLIGCGDTLTEDWATQAWVERDAAVSRFRVCRIIAAALVLDAQATGAGQSSADAVRHPAQIPTGAAGRRIRRRSPLTSPETLP